MMTGIVDNVTQDAEAVAAVRGGDAERYRELVERHERRVFAVAWSRLGDPTLAEEATQEAFIRGYRRLWLLGDDRKFAGWIASITRHIAINLGLRHRRELNKRERWALEQAPAHESPPPTAEADAPCTPETLRQTLAGLPNAHRECLVLFYLEGKSGAEAAAALGISEAALRVRLHRARAALRERLEERLADSLGKLGSGKSLVPAIMAGVLASSSAKAATATGGGAAILGTLVKFSPLKWLMPVFVGFIGMLPSLGLTAWVGKLEQRNYRDPDGFRAQAHRAMYRTILWVVPLVVIPMVIGIMALNSKLGQKRTDWILAVFMVGIFAFVWRTQRNRFQAGVLVWYALLTGGMVLNATGLVPPSAYAYFFLAASLWLIRVVRRQPKRMDNSLFLRAGLGLLEVPPPESSAANPTLRLTKSDMMRFGRFLGDRWLVNDFRWCPEGLLLRQTFMKWPWRTNKAGLSPFFTRDSSNILLGWNGEVTAHISEADERTRRALNAGEASLRAQWETQVAAAVKLAWQEFRNGNTAATERALGEKPDAEIFVVSPTRAASVRWQWVLLAVPVVLAVAAIVVDWHPGVLKPLIGRHPQPVSFSELDVRATLSQLGKGGVIGSNALRQVDMSLSQAEVLPAKTLLSSNAWVVMREHLLKQRFSAGGTVAQRVDQLLDMPDLLRLIANGWLGPEDFGLSPEEIRRSILDAPDAARRQWFAPQEVPAVNRDGTPTGYSALNTEELARRVQCLKRFGCLDAADATAAIEVLLKHQLLSEQLPAGRAKPAFPKLLQGTFLTYGADPIQDTYHALVVLENFGALDRVAREACIRGILRFHHGRGLFKSLQQGDGLMILGDSRDTFWAFESLRMLGALDRVKDLDRWQFRPRLGSKIPPTPAERRDLTWAEIEAWVLQQRLDRLVRGRNEGPQSPPCSLLEP
jgi:RNA polymerase sigma-70 factor (ECF subfamily)